MSEVKTQVAGSRLPGRKSGSLVVYVTDNEPARFELRVDTEAGDFIVVHDGIVYIAKTRKALEQHLLELVRAERKLTWTRYIVIDYEARAGTFGSGRSYELGRKRPDDPEISSLSLMWDVEDYSTAVQQPGQTRARTKTRRVYHTEMATDPNDPEYCLDNSHNESWSYDDKLPRGAVLYTPERLALLEEIRTALGKLDARLNEMFSGAPQAIAERIDKAIEQRGDRLLGPGSDDE